VERLIGALLGSLVGGGVTYYAERSQTTRVIQAGTEQYRQAAEDERRRAREAAAEEREASRRLFARPAAVDALESAALLDRGIPYLRLVGSPRQDWLTAERQAGVDEAARALAALHRTELVSLPVIADEDLQRRWGQLRRLCSDFQHLQVQDDDWKVARAQTDLEQYLAYVHASLQAWLHEKPMPPHLETPYLGRDSSAVWRWPPTTGPAAEARRQSEVPPPERPPPLS
jgi:hypothetical protein